MITGPSGNDAQVTDGLMTVNFLVEQDSRQRQLQTAANSRPRIRDRARCMFSRSRRMF